MTITNWYGLACHALLLLLAAVTVVTLAVIERGDR